MLHLLILLALLGSPNFRQREAATAALSRLACPALLPVLEAAERQLPTLEGRRRMTWVVNRLYAQHADAISRRMRLPPVECLTECQTWWDRDFLRNLIQRACASLGLPPPDESDLVWYYFAQANTFLLGVPQAVQVECVRQLVAPLIAAREPMPFWLDAGRREQVRRRWYVEWPW